MMASNMARLKNWIFVVVGAAVISGCGMYDDQPLEDPYDEEYETRRGQLSEFCQVEIEGHGTLDVEEEYLAQVVTCEHAGAPLETLKAQAIAARGYAKYITDVEQRPLAPTVSDQAYDCGRAPTENAKRAVRETAGQVLTHGGKLTAPFYVAGSTAVDSNSCRASGGADTQQYVTYNEGHTGARVHPTSLGWSGSPANRGAMSQNGAKCLAQKGWSAERILRFFYGDDIRVTQLTGACVDTSGDPADSGSGPVADGGDSAGTCDSSSSAPHIIPRSGWGARAPTANRRQHDPDRFTIHHTVTANDDSTPKRTVKNIQNFHMGKGWSDIGYHYLIDQDGKIYAGNPVDRQGAHAGGQNHGNIGIAFLGNYQDAQPDESQLESAGKLIRHLGDQYGIDVSSSTVGGHRDVGSTACPGNHLYSKIDRIIRHANGEADEDCDDATDPDDPSTAPAYQYVRIKAISDTPLGDDDIIDGFELDSVFFEAHSGSSSGSTHLASSVVSSSGVSNADNAVGAPDNDSCDNRQSTVAGITTGGEIVLKFDQSMSQDDTLHIVQGDYHSGLSDCLMSGTAEVSVSEDGSSWRVLNDDVSGNAAVTVSPSYVRFTKPEHDSTHNPLVEFEVDASSDIAEVEYLADDWSMGIAPQAPNFPHEYEFDNTGRRVLEARGLDASGNVLATDTIEINVEQDDSGSGSDIDSAMGTTLGDEGGTCSSVGNGGGAARCTDGRGGWSSGRCWAYVKAAMIRAGLATRADINELAAHAGMSGYSVQVSAAGFKRAADRAPGALDSTMGLKKVDTPPTQSPKGAVIAWSPGCMGAHSRYGHIEISHGDGYACSDYCGQIRGDASCASVYVPTN